MSSTGDTLSEIVKTQERLNVETKRIDNIYRELFGNGREGMKTQITRISVVVKEMNESNRINRRILWATLCTVVGTFVGSAALGLLMWAVNN